MEADRPQIRPGHSRPWIDVPAGPVEQRHVEHGHGRARNECQLATDPFVVLSAGNRALVECVEDAGTFKIVSARV